MADSAALHKAGLALLIISLFLFCLGAQPFHFGLWYQSEPTVLGVYIAAALACLWLALRSLAFPGLPTKQPHPVWWALDALILWSALASVTTDFPLRSWFGTPETGEGVLWYLALLALAITAHLLWKKPRFRPPLAAIAALAVTIMALFNLLFDQAHLAESWSLRPGKWNDYLGFAGFYLWIILASAFYHPASWRSFAGVTLLPALVILSSDSQTAWLVFLITLPCAALLHYARQPHAKAQARRFNKIFTRHIWLVALAPMLVWGLFQSDLTRDAIFATIAQKQAESQRYSHSLLNRMLLSRAAATHLAEDPQTLATGEGWGSYSDVLFRHAFLDETLHNYKGERWEPNWKMLHGTAFHSHNSFAEALLAAGLPALLALMALMAALLRYGLRRPAAILLPGWCGVTAMLTFWFQLPMLLPLMALAMASSLRPLLPREWRPFARIPVLSAKRLGYGSAAAACLFVLAATVHGLTASLAEKRMAAIQKGELPPPDLSPADYLPDYGRGGTHLWWINLHFTPYITSKLESGAPLTAADIAWYDMLVKTTHLANITGQNGLRAASREWLYHDELARLETVPGLAGLAQREYGTWRAALLRLATSAPKRIDIATHYFQYHSLRAETSPEARNALFFMAEDLATLNPAHPLIHWYRGMALIADPATETQALQDLHYALEHGVERFVPVSPTLRHMIENAKPSS